MWVQGIMIRRGQDQTNPFAAARGNETAMRPFSKSLWTLVEFGGDSAPSPCRFGLRASRPSVNADVTSSPTQPCTLDTEQWSWLTTERCRPSMDIANDSTRSISAGNSNRRVSEVLRPHRATLNTDQI